MEGGAQPEVSAPSYSLPPFRLQSEDILFCIDVDAESLVEMKTSSAKGRPITRLDSIKQSLLLFVHSKLTINPDHRFAFAVLAQSVSWVCDFTPCPIARDLVVGVDGILRGRESEKRTIINCELRKEFSNEIGAALAAVRSLSAAVSSYGSADLTQLFRIATQEAKSSRAQGRLLRVILVYCRSSIPPQHQWPVNQKLFTLDVIYLHDKPGPENCPQKVYDRLVDTLEHVSENEGYIYESGQGLSRILFRQMCILLSHPQQRCAQDDIDIPKSLEKKSPQTTDPTSTDESAASTNQ